MSGVSTPEKSYSYNLYSPTSAKRLSFSQSDDGSEDNALILELQKNYEVMLQENEVKVADMREKCRTMIENKKEEIRKNEENIMNRMVFSAEEKKFIKEKISTLKGDIDELRSVFNTEFGAFKDDFKMKRERGIASALKLKKIENETECELNKLRAEVDEVEREGKEPKIVYRISNFLLDWFISNSNVIQML